MLEIFHTRGRLRFLKIEIKICNPRTREQVTDSTTMPRIVDGLFPTVPLREVTVAHEINRIPETLKILTRIFLDMYTTLLTSGMFNS